MKKILIIEDDKYKCEDILSYIKSIRPDDCIDTAESLSSGYKSAIQTLYDFYVVDMNIPKFDKKPGAVENTMPNGGEILMETLHNMGIPSKFMIMTQYETFGNETLSTIEARLKASFGVDFFGTIHYASDSENWKSNLLIILQHALDINN